MKMTLLLSACLGLAAATPPLAAGAAAAPHALVRQDETPPVEDERELIEERLDALKDLVKDRGEKDREAIAIIDELLREWEACGPKDRADIVKELGKCFEQKRKEIEEGVPDNALFLACATALGRMGPESTKTLEKYIDHKKHRKDLVLQRRLVLSLGQTRDVDAMDTLEDLLVHKDAVMVAAAAEALGNFGEVELGERKDAFEALLKVLMSVKGQVDSDVNDIIARERYDAIAAPIVTTLQVLSGHDERDPNEWQRWWNKNKKADWDEPGE